jgi:hypothetical protein
MGGVRRTRPTWVFWAGIGAAAAMVIGGLGPWVTVLGDSANGIEVDDGWLAIGCGCLVAALLVVAFIRRKAGVAVRVALLLPALLVTRVTIADVYDVNTTAAGVFSAGAASVSWGLVLAAAGAVAALAIGVGALIARPVSLFKL